MLPQVIGEVRHVVPQVIGEVKHVVPKTIGEHTFVLPVIVGEQTYVLALILPVTDKELLNVPPVVANLLVSVGCTWSWLLNKFEVPQPATPFIRGIDVPRWLIYQEVVAAQVVLSFCAAFGTLTTPVNVAPVKYAFVVRTLIGANCAGAVVPV